MQFQGVVEGINPNVVYSPESIQVNGEKFKLASVTVHFDIQGELCGVDITEVQKSLGNLTAQLLPLGTKVLVVRDSARSKDVFIHRGTKDEPSPSINELLVRSGWARPVVWNPSSGVDRVQHENSLVYQEGLVAAWDAAKAERAGAYGLCDADKVERQRQEEEYLRTLAQPTPGANGSGSVSVNWGDGNCDSCRVARKAWRLLS